MREVEATVRRAGLRVGLESAGTAVGNVIGRAGLLIGFVMLFVALAFLAPNFLTVQNLLNVLRQVSFAGIIAFGMTLVIIGGEIDISVGAAVALASALLAVLNVNLGWPLPLAAIAVIIDGLLIGLLAGWVRVRFNVPSFIVTLGLFSALRGMALVLTNAFPISIPSESFAFWGSGYVPVVIMLAVFALFAFVSTRTVFGRSVYAVGGNSEAARLSGIPVDRVRGVLFAITGVLAAVSGILLSSRLAAGNANIAVGLEFDVISAVIIGGASLFGGRGTMVGTLIGILFIGLLANGMVLLGITPFIQQVVRGLIVVLAVVASQLRGRERMA